MPVLATAIIVIGIIIAVIGTVLTTRSIRRPAGYSGEGARLDLAVAVTVLGLIGMLFGAGYLGYLLLAQS